MARPGSVLRAGRGHLVRGLGDSDSMSEHTATPTRMTAAERREQLLDVTKAIVAERGFHAVSIEAVAREAGVTRPLIYGHFGDLNGMLEALVERESLRALTQLASILPTDLGARDAQA